MKFQKTLAFILSVILLTSFSSCGEDADTTAETPTTTTAKYAYLYDYGFEQIKGSVDWVYVGDNYDLVDGWFTTTPDNYRNYENSVWSQRAFNGFLIGGQDLVDPIVCNVVDNDTITYEYNGKTFTETISERMVEIDKGLIAIDVRNSGFDGIMTFIPADMIDFKRTPEKQPNGEYKYYLKKID